MASATSAAVEGASSPATRCTVMPLAVIAAATLSETAAVPPTMYASDGCSRSSSALVSPGNESMADSSSGPFLATASGAATSESTRWALSADATITDVAVSGATWRLTAADVP